MDKLTPGMKQYMEIKNKYPDCLVLFRMGDFYETFFTDAKIASKALDITLTKRGYANGEPVPLAGIPYHSLDNYLAKLIKQGFKVAICEQVEDPKKAKGLVKRDLVRIVTPGTLIEENLLKAKQNNYIMAISQGFGIAVADISTGEFLATNVESSQLANVVSHYSPAEIIVPYSLRNHPVIKDLGFVVHNYEDRHFLPDKALHALMEHFSVGSLDVFGIEQKEGCIESAGALISYLTETQKNSLTHLKKLKYYSQGQHMLLDAVTLRNLEIIENIKGSSDGTLLWILDKTLTPMGARLLRTWLLNPLLNLRHINERLDAVEELTKNIVMRQELNEALKNMRDIERLISRINYGNCSPRDLLSLKQSLQKIPLINNSIANSFSAILSGKLDELNDIVELIERAIKEEPNIIIREGNIIKDGYSPALDELHDLSRNVMKFIQQIEQKEREKTGIRSLKIGFNKVFGYYIEVSKSNQRLVPESYIRKQTRLNSERYITEELKVEEEKIIHAEEKINSLEYGLFMETVGKIAAETGKIQKAAEKIAVIDTLLSFAVVAVSNNYYRPEIHSSYDLILKDSRHPVVEAFEKDFIPNDIKLDKNSRTLIITGPNMAGKTTVMRQVAINILMAQIGCFVPAKAKIPIVNRIFSREGASDDLVRGKSTFMVEMSEAAMILNNATEKSLIIMDEIGRGTSTFDGVALAWSIAEYINNTIRAKTLFATHYHVLTKLEKFSGVKNCNIAVREDKGRVTFLRKLVEGGTDKSYGIYVAELAGIPAEVIESAREIQFKLEEEDKTKERIVVEKKKGKDFIELTKSMQKTLFDLE